MTVKRFHYSLPVILTTLSINSAQALPIDWGGVFGVDTHHISNFRRTDESLSRAEKENSPGTQGLVSGDSGASFQTYIFKLQPNIIVNDGVTLKGEFSSGFIRGGFLGGEATNTQDGSASNSYFFVTPAQRSELNVNQLYMELYADAALVKAGRFAKGYGMGMIFDAGTDAWDRFFTMYDGVEAEMKIGNFGLIPHYAKVHNYDEDDAADDGRLPGARPAGSWDVREMGVTAKYDNKNRDLVVAVLFAKRSSESSNSLYEAGTGPLDEDVPRGSTDVTVIEPYIAKKWNKLAVAAEASIQSGDYGDVYNTGENSTLAGTAFAIEGRYDLNPKWDVGFNVGQVSGDEGSTDKFEAIYLHPNYHIADLMFRYNYSAFNEGGRSIFNNSITNARYVRMFGNYKSDKWTWKAAFIFANAMETAEAGQRAYQHQENYAFTANEDQSDDYGYELDIGFDYLWNPNVTIGAYYGYWFVGDYWAFDNDTATEISLSNVHGGGLRATVQF